MEQIIQKLLKQEDLAFEETNAMIHWIMSEEANPAKAGALLALLQAKGPTIDEIAGAATAMRDKSAAIKAPSNSIDTCSTGGNGISTFNISTCAAIIAAAAGAVVAKHGNRTATRLSGSAEALKALGLNIELDVSQVEACLESVGICFCYAIRHHPAMRYAGPIRRDLGFPTIFNMLGPLTNPAGAKNQLMGVPSVEWAEKLIQVFKRLGSDRILIVNGQDGLCELTTTAPTYVAELRGNEISHYTVTAEELGFKPGKLDDIRIDSPEHSAQIIQQIFSGEEQGTARDIAILNAAGALVVGGIADDLKDGVARATEVIDSGKVAQKLKDLVDFTQQYS